MLVHRVCETVRQCRRRCTRLACLEIRENLILLFANYKQSGENLLEIGIITVHHAFRTSAHTLCIPVDRVKKKENARGKQRVTGTEVCMRMRYLRHAGCVCPAAQTNPRNTRVVVLCNGTCAPPRNGCVELGLTPFHKKSTCLLDKPCEDRKKRKNSPTRS